TRDKRDRCHQDRTQTVSVCLNDRIVARHSFRTERIRVVDLQIGILFNDAKKQQDAECRENIQSLSGGRGREQRERYRERQRQQDRDRVNERFELRRQHEIHKNERKQERKHRGAVGTLKLL